MQEQQIDAKNKFKQTILFCIPILLLIMYDTLLQDFDSFVSDIRGVMFQDIQKKFKQVQSNYVPQPIPYQQEFDTPNYEYRNLKSTPSFDKKRPFNNTDNLHRQIISIFKSFLICQMQDFRDYLRLTMTIRQLNKSLSHIGALSKNSDQFNLIYFLFTAGKRSIRLFMKLRDEILKEVSVDKNSFLPISTHNPSKYVQKQRYLQQIEVSRKKKQWQHLMTIAGYEYHDELAIDALKSQDQVSAHRFIQYCLWINKQTQQNSPKK